MLLKELKLRLDEKFIKPKYSDDWRGYPKYFEKYLTNEFKEKHMGLMFDFSKEIKKVVTCTFPSKESISKIKGEDILIVSHHAANWDIRNAPEVFEYLDESIVLDIKKRRISLYVLHVPLDEDHEFGTSVCLSEVLGLKKIKAFYNYHGALAGLLNEEEDLNIVKDRCEKLVGHRIGFYNYGADKGKVSVIGGGGFSSDVLKEMVDLKSNILVTGITILNKRNNALHEFCLENNINVIGLTHYSSEKFAMIKLLKYFEKLELNAEFIEETPVLEDI